MQAAASAANSTFPATRSLHTLATGVELMRLENTTHLYEGMKAHFGISLLSEGHAIAKVDGAEIELTPGMIQLKEPGQIHRDLRRDLPGTVQLISFDAKLIDDAYEALLDRNVSSSARLTEVRIMPSDERAAAFRRLHALALGVRVHRRRQLNALAVDVAVTEAVDALVAHFLTTSSSNSNSASSSRRHHVSVQRARTFLLDHFAEAVTLDALADHARADKFHLCRAFTAEIGFAPYQFLTQVRIARARVLLRRGVRPSDIAPMIGFCDQSQMHRHFVRIVGCTPGEYARA